MPRIKSLTVRSVMVPMATPHQTASGTVSASPLVLTDIVSSDGVVGSSMIFTYAQIALSSTAELVRNIFPLIEGEDDAPASIAARLTQRFRLLGSQGLVGMAIAAIDMALWDIQAKRHSTPLYRLLGSAPKPIRAYGAVGYDGEHGAARSAEHWARRGFLGVKAKIGYATVAEDVAVIRAMRQSIGPDVAIMVDYNQSLSVVGALHRLRVLDDTFGPAGLTWVEEPVLAHDYAGHAQVSAAAAIPIQCGENWWGPLDMRHALDAKASDLVMPDVMKIGGVTGWRVAAALAEAKGIPVSNHLWPEISAQLLMATPTAHWLEYADWWNPVLKYPLQIEAGLAVATELPGTGVEWDEVAIERMAV
jgi:mandelate racemase